MNIELKKLCDAALVPGYNKFNDPAHLPVQGHIVYDLGQTTPQRAEFVREAFSYCAEQIGATVEYTAQTKFGIPRFTAAVGDYTYTIYNDGPKPTLEQSQIRRIIGHAKDAAWNAAIKYENQLAKL